MTLEVRHGDSLEVLKTLEAESFDSLITDPPSGTGFMDAEWDSDKGGRDAWIAWLASILAEARRVLKPGAHGLIWALPRTAHWTATALEDAGFEVRDVVSHVFATGFPKSLDIAKSIDKKRDDREAILGVTTWLRGAREKAGKSNAQLDALFDCNGMAGHWTSTASQPAVPTMDQWWRIIEFMGADVPDEIAAEVARLNDRKGQHGDAYLEADVIGEMPSREGPRGLVDFLKSAHDTKIRAPSELAAEWKGWGTALKPASEHWILVRKPLGRRDGNTVKVAENVLKHGTGALHVDACRIATDWNEADRPPSWKASGHAAGPDQAEKIAAPPSNGIQLHPLGRWPTNFIMSHGETCDAETCEDGCPVPELLATDRAAGLERFFPIFRYSPKPATSETEAGLDDLPKIEGRHNNHPTKKPIELMRWMVRLITPPGGRVLDLFAGSGTTGCACALEHVDFLGIELDPRFAEIARARVAWWAGDFRAVQQSLF